MGKPLLTLLLLLLVAGGIGAWNYDRNLKKESQLPRPWKSYSMADLQSMEGAYKTEIKRYSKGWEQARGQRHEASGRGLVGDRAHEFDKIYASGKAVRGMKSKVAEDQAALDEIQHEIALRERDKNPMQVHMRRLLTF